MKIKHTRESDFKEVEQEYPIFQYELAEEIHALVNKKFDTKVPIVTCDDGKRLLILAVNEQLSRTDRKKYRITIEEI